MIFATAFTSPQEFHSKVKCNAGKVVVLYHSFLIHFFCQEIGFIVHYMYFISGILSGGMGLFLISFSHKSRLFNTQ